MGSRTLALQKHWVGSYYHSTYSAFSRGVSVLVHKSLQFTLLDLHLDPEGTYVALHAMCDRLELLIVGLYYPLPATLTILHKLAPSIALYPRAGVLLAGDFNMTPNPNIDRFNADSAVDSPLSRWAEVYGCRENTPTLNSTRVIQQRMPLYPELTCSSLMTPCSTALSQSRSCLPAYRIMLRCCCGLAQTRRQGQPS